MQYWGRYSEGDTSICISSNALREALEKVGFNYAADIRGEMWGKAFYVDNYVMFNKDILIKQMRAEGYEFDAVKSQWANKGYLVLNSQGRYPHYTKCNDVKAMYIKIVLPHDEKDVHSLT